MSFIERLDPELAAVVETIAPGLLDLSDLPAARDRMARARAAQHARLPKVEGVAAEDRTIPASSGAPDVRVRIYRPTLAAAPLPALLWMHGGGYILGNLDQDNFRLSCLAKAVNCVVVSVDYRLAPEHPFPAALDDCRAAYDWLTSSSGDLGVDPSRVAIGGASAGGGLAAALAMIVRDAGRAQPVMQLLLYPMIDDRQATRSSQWIDDPRVWNRETNQYGWKCYLGEKQGGSDVSCLAAAARAENLENLPPAYIPVGAVDLFLDEDIDYARRLMEAGVPTELHVYPGAFHGFDSTAPLATLSRRFIDGVHSALVRAFAPRP